MSTTYSDFNKNLIGDLRANQGQATSGPFRGGSVLILTTTGAKSGETRENPLAYTRTGDDYVVIASKGGALDIYYRGQLVTGSWSAADRGSPFVFKNAAGQEINLPNGLVWVNVVGN